MGIEKLNTLLNNANTYEGKFNTIIIDGSNMIITILSAVVGSIKSNNLYAQWGVFDLDLITTFNEIITQATNSIVNMVRSTRRMLLKDGIIIFIVDSSNEPVYYTADGKELYIKSEERELRKQKQDRTKTINSQIEYIKLHYGIYKDGVCINEDEIRNLFLQLDYFNNAGNYLTLIPIILNKVMKECNNVTFIRAKSEADFVIKNLAFVYHTDPVLVMSEDTDYFVLLSDIENVYKTSLKRNKPIYYPYEFWKTLLHENVTYNEIIYLVTLMGNDYVGHNVLLSLDPKNHDKNVKRVRAMLNIDNTFEDEILKSRMIKIKKVIGGFKPKGILQRDDLEEIFKNSDHRYKNAIDIYNNWYFNADYEIIIYDEDELEKLIDDKLNKYQTQFGKLYVFGQNELTNCIEELFREEDNDDPDKIEFKIITDFKEYYEEISYVKDYLMEDSSE